MKGKSLLKGWNLVLIGLIIFGGFILYFGFGLNSIALLSTSPSNVTQGSYYSMNSQLYELSVKNMVTNVEGSSNQPLFNVDGALMGDFGKSPSVYYYQGFPYYSDIDGIPLDSYQASKSIGRVKDGKVYVWNLFQVSVDMGVRTIATLNVEDAKYAMPLVLNIWTKTAEDLLTIPAKRVSAENEPVQVSSSVYLGLTPFTFGSSQVEIENGSIEYYFDDCWMGVLGARLTSKRGGEVYAETRYSNEIDNVKSSWSRTTYTDKDDGFTVLRIDDVNTEPKDPHWYEQYEVYSGIVGSGIPLTGLEGESLNTREFNDDLALTNAPDEVVVTIDSQLKAGIEYYYDWVRFRQWENYAFYGWIPDYHEVSPRTEEYCVGGRSVNVFMEYTITFDVVVVASWDMEGEYIPDYFELEVPTDLLPNMQVVGEGRVIDNWRPESIASITFFIIFFVIVAVIGVVVYFYFKRGKRKGKGSVYHGGTHYHK